MKIILYAMLVLFVFVPQTLASSYCEQVFSRIPGPGDPEVMLCGEPTYWTGQFERIVPEKRIEYDKEELYDGVITSDFGEIHAKTRIPAENLGKCSGEPCLFLGRMKGYRHSALAKADSHTWDVFRYAVDGYIKVFVIEEAIPLQVNPKALRFDSPQMITLDDKSVKIKIIATNVSDKYLFDAKLIFKPYYFRILDVQVQTGGGHPVFKTGEVIGGGFAPGESKEYEFTIRADTQRWVQPVDLSVSFIGVTSERPDKRVTSHLFSQKYVRYHPALLKEETLRNNEGISAE